MENVIVQTAFLGDLFLAIPLIRRWREIDPSRPLVLICRKGLGSYFLDARLVDQVIEVDKKDSVAWKRQMSELQAREFANIICPHESLRSALLVKGMKCTGLKIGFKKWWNFWAFNRRVERPMFFPDALRQLSLLTALDSSFAEEFSQLAAQPQLHNATDKSLSLVDFTPDEIPQWAAMAVPPLEQAAVAQTPTIFIGPGSVWATKRWTLEGFTTVARTLDARGYNVILIGSEAERDLCEQIRTQVPGAVNLAGQSTITQTIEIFRRGIALISNDSGAMHLAAVAGLPTVAIFGPTTLDIGYRPWQQAAVVVQHPLKCRPCGKHGSDVCPIGTHECMKAITPDQVLSALAKLEKSTLKK